jgi:hypothetical protein
LIRRLFRFRQATELSVLKTIKLGSGKTSEEYRKALEEAACRIGDWGNEILGKTACAQEETEVDLVALSVKELGFNEGAYYKDICTKALGLGLELCPAEAGPALRLVYRDQSRGEWLRIAMEAIPGSEGDRFIFAVNHVDDGLSLDGDYGDPEFFWEADGRFVFLRRKVRTTSRPHLPWTRFFFWNR